MNQVTVAHRFSPACTPVIPVRYCNRSLRTRAVAGKPLEHDANAPRSTAAPYSNSNGASPPSPNIIPPVFDVVAGAGAYQNAVEAGAKKANQPPAQTFKMAVLTGFYVGIGCVLMYAVGGQCPGLAASNPGLVKILLGLIGLPTALLIILIAGGDLYTGNTALLTAAIVEGRATYKQMVQSWVCSYVGNFIGCIAVAYLFAGSGLLATNVTPKAIALYKTSLPFHQAFIRGIFGNWMVCLAVYMCGACTTMSGKMCATFLCIPAFVAMGLEHCIANMFMVPIGMLHGAEIPFSHYVTSSLIPVTLGNTFAGVVCVGLTYASIYGKLGNYGKPASANK